MQYIEITTNSDDRAPEYHGVQIAGHSKNKINNEYVFIAVVAKRSDAPAGPFPDPAGMLQELATAPGRHAGTFRQAHPDFPMVGFSFRAAVLGGLHEMVGRLRARGWVIETEGDLF
jgi:hypothetical protein